MAMFYKRKQSQLIDPLVDLMYQYRNDVWLHVTICRHFLQLCYCIVILRTISHAV